MAGYHLSDLVKDAATVLNIELYYLPPYNPKPQSNRAVMAGDEREVEKQRLLQNQTRLQDRGRPIFCSDSSR
ncbi:hypothetical protein VroAM7_05210 [Vibrio rotiferianus]|uniref:Tc1-like transposase DDE domain-containing protein n=1 Tax=Vibrio rotiferianus TaxID=190895 RepID=A0A510I3S5_9VIBR|nr:hypothetical protein VroAM7_05210 [Vibrio rotiferianus]